MNFTNMTEEQIVEWFRALSDDDKDRFLGVVFAKQQQARDFDRALKAVNDAINSVRGLELVTENQRDEFLDAVNRFDEEIDKIKDW